MWPPTDISYRKFRRKVAADGLRSTLVSAADLVFRKKVGRSVVDPLLDSGVLRTVSRAELVTRARRTHSLGDGAGTLSPPFVADIGPGYVLPTTGLSLTDSLEIVEETAAAPDHARQATMACLSRQAFFGDRSVLFDILSGDRSALESDATPVGTVLPLSPRYPNYYHWLVETVPKVRYAEAYERETGADVTLLVPDGVPPYADETLDLLDWPQDKITRATAPVYRAEQLLVPSFPEPRIDDYRWLRSRILGALSERPSSSTGASNVYVSRSNAVERRVVNEPAVVSMLRAYGFESYNLEEQSLATNARLFADADLVVAPHGAGLADIVFAEDCTVVELFGSKVKQPYELLAETLDLEYERLVCEPRSTDIVVDVEALEAMVSDLSTA
ncbi:glycosyltransferase family 61 protein [Haloplanus rubicundus]|uniref:Glycosyltransferase family 61 protein n=1 Tax=Haloplanus rubicundus TaxID=1547898 RepID=A0A345E7J7_9EURY|nr:glycosyltransferase family 61 protein [Haloplanus rubicundus]AXG08169.1 glycosyltransferase family 61 protein [Haloplanus rubicundus]